MKMKRIFSFGVCLFFLLSSFSFLKAAVPDKAKYTRKRLHTDFYLSPRALGRGNTYITTAKSQDALFLNPALLPVPDGIYDRTYLLDPTVVVSTRSLKTVKEFTDISSLLSPQKLDDNAELTKTFNSVLDVVKDWETDATSMFTSVFFGSFFKYVGFGFLSSASLDLDSGLTTVKSRKESVRINSLITAGPSVAVAYPVLPNLSIGVSFRYLFRFEINVDQEIGLVDFLKLRKKAKDKDLNIKDYTAFDHRPALDFGIVYKPDLMLSPSFGLVFSNIGTVNFQDRDGFVEFEMEPLRQNLGLGVSIHPDLGPGVLTISLDQRDLTGSYDTSFFSETYLGADYLLLETFGLSMGLSQGYPSMNLYLTTGFLQLDLGFYTKERELSVGTKADPRFFFKLTTSL